MTKKESSLMLLHSGKQKKELLGTHVMSVANACQAPTGTNTVKPRITEGKLKMAMSGASRFLVVLLFG
jgi:hypothetical protein